MIVSETRTGRAGRTRPNRGGCGCGGGGEPDCGCAREKGIPPVEGSCDCGAPERCGVPCLERPVYSAGQLLTADALRLGQRYAEERFALRRYIDGVGVVCGLHVRCDPDRPGWIIVEPGFAVDCCGHDLTVCEPVRMDLCAAIAECPRPVEPCGEVEVEERKEEPLDLGPAQPGDEPRERNTRTGVVTGTVRDQEAQPLEGVSVRLIEVGAPTLTNANGRYLLKDIHPGTHTGRASMVGYGDAERQITVGAGQTTTADFRLLPQQTPTPAPGMDTYVLRAEPAWSGRDPVPVVSGRDHCDPRPACRPSREVAGVRLCVEPLEERTDEAVARRRTTEFREKGRELAERLDYVLESANEADRSSGMAVADALLAYLEGTPLRTSCNLVDLICDVRRILRGGEPRCFAFEADVLEDPERALVGFVGQLVDDLREAYLAVPCDDCCERTGVRLAEVLVQDVLDDCSGAGCSIAAIDSHAPARETLHPRSAWWMADRVAVHDAYFQGVAAAAVLLTGRGLQVEKRDANQSPFTPTWLPQSVRGWMTDHGGEDELGRFGVYAQSELWVAPTASVVLWTVAERVVAITPGFQKYQYRVERAAPSVGGMKAYLRYGRSVPRAEVAPERRTPGEPEDRGALDVRDLDPAPFKEMISGVGDKYEAALYRKGIRTLWDVVHAPIEELERVVGSSTAKTMAENCARMLEGEGEVEPEKLREWAKAARARYDAVRKEER